MPQVAQAIGLPAQAGGEGGQRAADAGAPAPGAFGPSAGGAPGADRLRVAAVAALRADPAPDALLLPRPQVLQTRRAGGAAAERPGAAADAAPAAAARIPERPVVPGAEGGAAIAAGAPGCRRAAADAQPGRAPLPPPPSPPRQSASAVGAPGLGAPIGPLIVRGRHPLPERRRAERRPAAAGAETLGHDPAPRQRSRSRAAVQRLTPSSRAICPGRMPALESTPTAC